MKLNKKVFFSIMLVLSILLSMVHVVYSESNNKGNKEAKGLNNPKRIAVVEELIEKHKLFKDLLKNDPSKEEKKRLIEMLNSDDYLIRIIASTVLFSKTNKRYPVVKKGEEWNSIILKLLKDLEVLVENAPISGYIPSSEFQICSYLVAIGKKTVPFLIESLSDVNKHKYFRICLLKAVLSRIDRKLTINESLKILDNNEEDDVLRINAIRTLSRTNDRKTVRLLRKIYNETDNPRVLRVILIDLKRMANEGNRYAFKIHNKLKVLKERRRKMDIHYNLEE